MSGLLKNLRFWNRLYVAHLEEEILYLRGRVDHERSRAEMAIDTLLNVRVGVTPVSVQTSPAPEAEIARIMDRLGRSEEFTRVGEVDDE
jgi:hypothetical protein